MLVGCICGGLEMRICFLFNALSFPTICCALPNPVDLSAYPVLNELELADCVALIGQNHLTESRNFILKWLL